LAMRFGVFFQAPEAQGQSHAERYTEMFELIALAEELGVDVAWLAELHFGGAFSLLPNPLMMVPVIAQRTRRIRIGTAVTLLPLPRGRGSQRGAHAGAAAAPADPRRRAHGGELCPHRGHRAADLFGDDDHAAAAAARVRGALPRAAGRRRPCLGLRSDGADAAGARGGQRRRRARGDAPGCAAVLSQPPDDLRAGAGELWRAPDAAQDDQRDGGRPA